jgi:hypothetical protein
VNAVFFREDVITEKTPFHALVALLLVYVAVRIYRRSRGTRTLVLWVWTAISLLLLVQGSVGGAIAGVIAPVLLMVPSARAYFRDDQTQTTKGDAE